jgi:AcrR family transcriptional regulator
MKYSYDRMNSRDPIVERLLDAAGGLFARHGYAGASVREITRRARANLGAITYHFGSKEALYYQVIASRTEPLVARIAEAAAAPGLPLDRIEAIVRTFFEHIGTHPEMPKLILRELTADRPLPPPALRAIQHNFGAIVDAVKAGQQDRTIRSGDPVLLALSVMAQPFHFAVAGRMVLASAGFQFNEPDTRARIVDHVVITVRRALAA